MLLLNAWKLKIYTFSLDCCVVSLPLLQVLMELSEAVTESDVKRGQHVWTIERFSLLGRSVGEEFKGRQFELVGNKWRLFAYPGGREEKHAGYVAVYLSNWGDADVTAGWA